MSTADGPRADAYDADDVEVEVATHAGGATSAVSDLLLAVDGGNSKTDVRLVRADGTEVRRAIGGPFRPQSLGVPAAMAVLDGLIAEVLDSVSGRGTADTETGGAVQVRGIAAFLAGADLPEEISTLHAEIEARAWADRRSTLRALAAAFGSGKAAFFDLGAPRPGHDDNPSLGTGAYALDQSWHVGFLFFAALIVAAGA